MALDRGLQRAIQSEIGARVELPSAFSLESKLFAHFYRDMLALDALEFDDIDCSSTGSGGFFSGQAEPPASVTECQESDDFARMRAHAYGSEWMLRRDSREVVSGWLSYTLAKADAYSSAGRKLTPNFDVRHVANLVFQWRITPKWHVALRGFAQSGRYPLGGSTETDPRKRARLPAFYRGDLQIARTWARRWGELRVAFDWLNFTFQREPIAWYCHSPWDVREGQPECEPEYLEFPITLPMLGIRGTF